MAPYQSLYRKHRPQTFGALVGQEHVTTALRNAVKDGRVGHAYLFSGPRGTGKTTTARVLAKALNCLDLQADGEPCGGCENCVTLAEGRFLDLFELDAASNNSVDNIRDLTESVNLGLGPTAKRKVYLVDEVHMLSAAASNALLKTLEEPPDHVVFVLATTNPEKVLPTIRSRAQHFDFRLLGADELLALLEDITKQEGVDADPDALAVLARAAAGSARDALSLLDQALAHETGRLGVEAVSELFGRTPFDVRGRVLDAVAAEDAPLVLTLLRELLEAGHEPRRVAEDLLRAARDAFLLTAGGGQVPLDIPEDEQDRLRELGRALGNTTLVRVLETLGQAVVDMRGTDAADPRLVLEIALVRLTRREAGPPLQTVIERIERLERAVAALGGGGSDPGSNPPPAVPPTAPRPSSQAPGKTIGAIRRETPAPPPGAASEGSSPSERTVEEQAPSPSVMAPPAESEREEQAFELDDVIVAWAAILPGLPVATRSAVQEAQPLSVADDVITFGVPPRLFEAARPRFHRERETIRDALSQRLGRTARFTLVAHEGFAAGSGPVGTVASSPSPVVEPDPVDESEALTADDPAIDPGELVDADTDDRPDDSMRILTDSLGATVVEERPRE